MGAHEYFHGMNGNDNGLVPFAHSFSMCFTRMWQLSGTEVGLAAEMENADKTTNSSRSNNNTNSNSNSKQQSQQRQQTKPNNKLKGKQHVSWRVISGRQSFDAAMARRTIWKLDNGETICTPSASLHRNGGSWAFHIFSNFKPDFFIGPLGELDSHLLNHSNFITN